MLCELQHLIIKLKGFKFENCFLYKLNSFTCRCPVTVWRWERWQLVYVAIIFVAHGERLQPRILFWNALGKSLQCSCFYCSKYRNLSRQCLCGVNLCIVGNKWCRSQWPCGLRCRSAAARLLRLWVWILPGAWIFVCCECCVLSGRGPCDGLITHPEESYRLWSIVLSDLETSSRMKRPWTVLGCSVIRGGG